VGSGELYWMGVVSTRTLLTTAQFGVAGIYFNGVRKEGGREREKEGGRGRPLE